MNKKPVRIFLNARINAPAAAHTKGDCISSVVEGTYYLKGDKHYILYDEYLSPGEEITKSSNTLIISFKENVPKVDLLKKGAVGSHMTFIPGERFATSYRTPQGVFLMEINTSDLQVEISQDISILIDYKLYLNDEYISHNYMEIKIQ